MQEKVTETRSKTRLTESENITLRVSLKFQILILTVKTNTKEPYHRKKKTNNHTSSSLTTWKYRRFTKKAISQNQLCRQPGNSPQNTKSNQATIIVSAELQLLQVGFYKKALSQKCNFSYVGEESPISLEYIQHWHLFTSCLTVLFCLS